MLRADLDKFKERVTVVVVASQDNPNAPSGDADRAFVFDLDEGGLQHSQLRDLVLSGRFLQPNFDWCAYFDQLGK